MDVIHPFLAEFLGYTRYDEFRIKNESTYVRLCEDSYEYFINNPAAAYYRCWVPEFGTIHVYREALGGKYAVT